MPKNKKEHKVVKRGRPPLYKAEIADYIIEKLCEGVSIRKICLEKGMPNSDTLYNWINKYPEFAERYRKAKAEYAEAMAEKLLDIADEATPEMVAVAKLRVETRKWILARLAPKKYGDRTQIELTGDADAPVQINMTAKTDQELNDAIKKLLE